MSHVLLLCNQFSKKSPLISDPTTDSEDSKEEYQLAYQEACSRGSNPNYRIHLAVIGHSEAGKTSFIDRLLSKEFQQGRKSTEGIHTHFVESSFNKKDIIQNEWTETIFEASVLEKKFHDSILGNIKSRGLQNFPTESPNRKVERWLRSTTLHRPTDPVDETPCQKSGQDLSKFSSEKNKASTDDTGPEKTVAWNEGLTQLEFKTDSQSEKRIFAIGKEMTEHVIAKPKSGHFSQFLNKSVHHEESQTANKDEWGKRDFIKISSDAKDSLKDAPVGSAKPTNNGNETKEIFHLDEGIDSTTLAKMSSDALTRLKQRQISYTAPSDERIPYSINIWDHGGQNEFIITNQLFLNVDAFILMVMDLSLDLNVPLKQNLDVKGKHGIPKTPAQILCYWLNALHVLGTEKRREPNIALVLTHKDLIQADDAKKYIDSYLEDLFQCIKGKPYAYHIKEENIFVIDNREGTDEEFQYVRNKLFTQMTQQNSWGKERPTRWLKLEADILEKAKEIGQSYLYIPIVKNLASALAMNKHELESFLKFHHDLGDFIYYPDKNLSDIVVTNPQWLLAMFKSLITPHEFLQQRQLEPKILKELKSAIISEESLKVVWKRNDAEFLKDVMVKFDLILPLGSEKMTKQYLIPCMLPPQEAQLDDPDPFTGMMLIYNATLVPECGDTMQVGAIHKLLSLCSKTPRWTVCANDQLSYTQALIEIQDGVRMELKLRKNNSIDVSIWCSRGKLDDGYLSINEARDLTVSAHRTIGKCMKISGLSQKGYFKMLCPHWSPGEEYVCLITVEEKEEVLQYIPTYFSKTEKCTMHKKELESVHFPWTKENFDSDGKFWIKKKTKESLSDVQQNIII